MKKKQGGGFIGFLALLVAIFAIVKIGAAIIKWAFAFSLIAVIAVVIAVLVLAMKSANKKDPNVEMSDNQNPAMKRRPANNNGPTIVPPAGTEEPADPAAPKLTVEQENILSKGRTNLLELRKIITKIKDPEIHQMSNEICDVNEKILKTLREKPDKIPQVRQFLNYYLPTLGEILVKYERIERSGVPAQKSEEKVEKYLVDIKKAMEKQYENLYDDDKLDLSVEMEAMTMAAKSDGLISDENYKIEQGDQEITLTL
ncbi:MAG: 5-bromo-4-chloroindolyl phosphate hydrolysis family protein [Lachnospiraceae bacterium]|nr:5-bromo-4-chloroindolyl phosphate hydrolysis family protein [Lachnospiraceae bacterium]